MTEEGLQDLRKELKQWESAFTLVHQRKPDKNDIAQAPKDIKEKYQLYFKKKKETGSENDSVLKSPTLPNTKAGGDVWGTEWNKKPSKDHVQEVEKEETLNRLGEKLAQNLCKIPQEPKSRVQKKGFFTKFPSGTDNAQESSSHSGSLCAGSSSTSDRDSLPMPEDDDDFTLKGNIFNKTGNISLKKHSSSSLGTISNKVSITTKPRLSFLSKNLSGVFRNFVDGNDSNITSGLASESMNSHVQADSDVQHDSNNFQADTNVMAVSYVQSDSEKQRNFTTLKPIDRTECVSDSESPIRITSLTVKTPKVDQSHTVSQDVENIANSTQDSGVIKRTAPVSENRTKYSVLNSKSEFRQSCSKEPSNVSDAFAFMDDQEQHLDECGVQKYRTARIKRPLSKWTEKPKISQSSHSAKDENSEVDLSGVNTGKGSRVKHPPKAVTVRVDHPEEETVMEEMMAEEVNDTEPVSCSSSSLMDKKAKAPTRKRGAAAMNENFVCLNMKRKGYRRKGGAGLTAGQLRKKQWKAKMASRSKSFGTNKCFKCGEEGHWANKCKGKSTQSQRSTHKFNKESVNSAAVEEDDFPNLREAVTMGRGIKDSRCATKSETDNATDMDDITDLEATIVREKWEPKALPQAVPSLADHVKDVDEEMKRGLSLFGFTSFRPGQEKSISRVLQGLSTLVVLSTGGGKSLCYQLPAYLYATHLKAITLVISPLVSLMEDQITGLPPGVKGACLHSNMTKVQKDTVISDLKEGKIHFLLVSPEAVVERGGFSQGSFPTPDRLPPIAFACIDEAHCLSDWSHNFRPSYLRLCKVLRERYGVKCFLGLTATATKATARDVVKHLGIDDADAATVRGAAVPKNLVLSVSRDANKDEALVELLKGERFKTCESIIIYCSRRQQTTRVATLIRTSLQTTVDLNETYQPPPAKKRKGAKSKCVNFDPAVWTCESYHAGLTPAKRKSVQKAFMSGKLRVVVATVAFGMGLDKANVRAVIHYNMSKSFESYVQEVGRAGRDGEISHCHAFLDPEDKDVSELRRHTFGNSIDRITIKKLLTRVFKPCRCAEIYSKANISQIKPGRSSMENQLLPIQQIPALHAIGGSKGSSSVDTALHHWRRMSCRNANYFKNRQDGNASPMETAVCGGHERAMSIEETVQWLDIREEGVSTLLCYLELHPDVWVENMNHVYVNCSIKCYGGARQLQALAKKCPPVAIAIAKQKLDGALFSEATELAFSVIDVCDSMGWDSGTVKRELKSLEWESGPSGYHKSGALVELSDLGFHFRSRGDLTSQEMDDVLEFLATRAQSQERIELKQLDMLAEALTSISHKNYWMCSQEADVDRSDRLKKKLEEYFDRADRGCEELEDVQLEQPDSSELNQLLGDLRTFISTYGQEHRLTGRAIARIFHGIASPCFPAETWGRVRRFWRSNLNIDFNFIIKEATRLLVAYK